MRNFTMKKKRFLWAFFGLLVIVAMAYVVGRSNGDDNNIRAKVKVTRGDIVEKALAVGTIEPKNEVSVKSKISGVVKRIYAEPGTYVHTGDPLLEVRPDPTPLELAESKRNVELAQVEIDNMLKEKARHEALLQNQLISDRAYDDFLQSYQESQLRLQMNKEKLALMESGKISIGGTSIESIIKSSIDGYVLSKSVEVGDPVTPLTSFQEGTVLMKMANMENLLFKGTVDEIDVGKLHDGMPAEMTVGALPGKKIPGRLAKISLKAEKIDNTTVFPIEILIAMSNGTTLRAGYSANADIIIQKKEDVLMIPERVVTFSNDSAFVEVVLADNNAEQRFIETGLSDAINIEVATGVSEGDELYEKEVKKIE
jgi:HlyD family secretion protein